MIPLARWTTRSFTHELPLDLFPALLERLRGTPARAADLLAQFAQPLRLWQPDPASWSAQQHIGHLDDLHDLDMARVRDFEAGADVLTAADMTNRKTNEASHNQTPTDALIDRLRRHRDELIERLERFNEADAARSARHPRLQRPMRVIDWMYFVAEHDDHHLARARETLRSAIASR
jgi:DinB superfamily